MDLSFLDKEASQEIILRIQREREPEEKRHRGNEAEITADFSRRGMLHSSTHLVALRNEQIEHIRRICCICREQLFDVVESRSIRLKDEDVRAIIKYLSDGLSEGGRRLRTELEIKKGQFGLPHIDHKIEAQIAQLVEQEAVAAVSLKTTELQRQHDATRRRRRAKRVEKFIWLIIGSVIGIAGTLVCQLLSRWIR